MSFSSLSNKIKDKLNSGADRFLSAKVKEELGFNKPTIDSLYNLSANQNIEDDLNSFYKPVNATFLSQRQYKKIKNLAIILIALISFALIALFISMIVPKQKLQAQLENSEVFVAGSKLLKPEEKIAEAKIEDTETKKGKIEVKDINISDIESTEVLAKSSPLVKSEDIELNKYKILPGDTLEKIALKFFGQSDPSTIDKIKVANKIRNVRLLRVGQEIIIPMG